jgi:hypothetical protein
LGSPVSTNILKTNFDQLKKAVCQTLNLQLFDPNKTVFILTDASDLGVGAILLQPYKKDPTNLVPIAFYSKSFSPTTTTIFNIGKRIAWHIISFKS